MSSNKFDWNAALEDAFPETADSDAVTNIDIDVNNMPTDEDGAPLESVDAEGEPSLDMVETDIVDAEAEVAEAEELVDNLQETEEVLEAYAVAIESRIQQNGGLTASEMELIKIGVCSRIPGFANACPSNESFTSGRLSASNEALEKVKEGAKKAWETIKKAIQAVINKIRSAFVAITEGGNRLAKRAKAISQKAGNVNGNAKSADVKVAGVNNILNPNGTIPRSKGDLIKGVSALEANVSAVLTPDNKNVSNVLDTVATITADIVKSINDIKGDENASGKDDKIKDQVSKAITTLKASTSAYKLSLNDSLNSGTKTAAEARNLNVASKGVLPGGKALIVLNGPKSGDEGTAIQQNLTETGLRLVPVTGFQPNKGEEDTNLQTLTPGDVKQIAGQVEKIGDVISKYKRGFEARETAINAAMKKMDGAIKTLKKEGDAKTIKQLAKGLQNFSRGELSAQQQLCGHAIRCGKVYLLACTRSLAQYEKGK